jgi:L-fuculose-phosphate aldolase
VKYDVAVANRVLAELGLAADLHSSVGHASQRVPSEPDRFVVKGRGHDMDVLAQMRPEDMVVCDLDGGKVGGPPGVSQCYEVKLHSCIYRDHPRGQAVVHVHPRFCVLMSVLGIRIRPMSTTGGAYVKDALAVYPHAHLVQTEAHGSDVSRLLDGRPAVLLQGHGIVTAGSSLEQAVTIAARLEEQAMLNAWARSVAGPGHSYISDELMLEQAAGLAAAREELPHFAGSYNPARPRVNGFWAYYTELAAQSL